MLNKDILLGKWKEIAGEIQTRWGKISENELQQVKGNVTALVGLIQQKFGVSKEEAEKLLNTEKEYQNIKNSIEREKDSSREAEKNRRKHQTSRVPASRNRSSYEVS